MAFREMPDCKVPPSDQRCEAMTKGNGQHGYWHSAPHRCVRRASQMRSGHAVCANHARVSSITFWDGEAPDAFQHKPFWRWPLKLQKMLGVAR